VKVEFKESFAKDLKAVKDGGLLKRVGETIEAVEKADSLAGLPNLKKLKGGGNYFRLRLGDYRLGLALNDDTVTFIRLLNRKDIYRYFP
jgi:mRNA interferase RelE/StbE